MSGAWRVLRVLLTWALVAAAVLLAIRFWNVFTTSPWTRDGRVRAYVVTVAPQVSGVVTRLNVADNQFVRRGDVLFEIDPADYRLALEAARGALQSAQADAEVKNEEAARRERLSNLSVSTEQRQQAVGAATVAAAASAQALARLHRAELDLARAEVRSPVDGWITNLLLQQGDYMQAGTRALALVDATSFWVDAYFEETVIPHIAEGAPARVWLMGQSAPLSGHVASVARGIQSSEASSGANGLASVNPVFTWVRLAQRVPVRIAIDAVPPGVRLVAGTTASVEVGKAGRR